MGTWGNLPDLASFNLGETEKQPQTALLASPGAAVSSSGLPDLASFQAKSPEQADLSRVDIVAEPSRPAIPSVLPSAITGQPPVQPERQPAVMGLNPSEDRKPLIPEKVQTGRPTIAGDIPPENAPSGLPPAQPLPTALTGLPSIQPQSSGERNIFGEAAASVVRGVGGVMGIPRGFLGAFDIKTGPTEALAKSGKELAAEYPESPSVGGEFKTSNLANPKWWASALPGLAVQILPIIAAGVGVTLVAPELAVGGVAAGTIAGMTAGGVIGVSDAGQRMLDYEERTGKELPTLTKITIGLGAGAAGSFLPGATVGHMVEGKMVGETAEKALLKVFGNETVAKAIAERAITAASSGSSMAGFSVIENAFEKYGYHPDKELTQGVFESLVLGTMMGGIQGEITRFKKAKAEGRESQYLDDFLKNTQQAYDEANQNLQRQYGGGQGTVIGEQPVEVQSLLGPTGQPTLSAEAHAALAKAPWERNAHEKLLADQARKPGIIVGPETSAEGGPIIPGETNFRERAQTAEDTVTQLQRAADVAGKSTAGQQLSDLLDKNQEILANAFRAPSHAPGMPEIANRIKDLSYQLEDTGDPSVARELHDYINSNLGALRAYPAWPVMAPAPEAPVQPQGPAGTETIPAPRTAEITPESTPLPGTAVQEPTTTETVKPEVKPETPAAPMGVGGSAGEAIAAGKPVETTPTPIPTPTGNVAPGASEKVGQETQAGRGVGGTGTEKQPWEMTKAEYAESISTLKPRYNALLKEVAARTGADFRMDGGLERAARGEAFDLLKKEIGDPNLTFQDISGYGHKNKIREAITAGRTVPPEVLADYPDLAAKYGEATQANPPAPSTIPPEQVNNAFAEGNQGGETLPGKGELPAALTGKPPETANPARLKGEARADVENDAAYWLQEQGGIDPKFLKDYASEPEERTKLSNLFILKKGGMAPDDMFTHINAEHPGFFTNADDMMRYFQDGRYERNKMKGGVDEWAKRYYDAEEEQERNRFFDSLPQAEKDHYAQLPAGEGESWFNQQWEAHLNERIRQDTEREGYSGEDVATAENALKNEIAAENATGGSAGDLANLSYEELAARYGGEAKYSLKTRTALESRFANLQTDYPDIDREKALQVIRTFPKATNDQIANMVGDPEMFNRVVQGTLSAAEQKMMGGAVKSGVQGGLFGGGEQGKPGGGRLFKTNELPEALAPKGAERVTKEQVQAAFPGAKITESQALKGLYDGFQVDLPNGMRIIVRRDEFIMPQAASLEAGYGKTSLSRDEYIAGEYRRMTKGGMISLAKGEGAGTLSHETFHSAMDLVLTEREKAAVLQQYGDEEAAARAYGSWDPKAKPDTIFGKIMDFFRQIYRGLFPDAEGVFGKVKGGKVWGRRGNLPEALAPSKYRVKEVAIERAREEKDAAKAWYGRVSEQLGKWLNAPRLRAGEVFPEEALKTKQSISKSQAEADLEIKRMAREFTDYAGKMGPIIGKEGEVTPSQEFARAYQAGELEKITDPTFKAFGEYFRQEERRQMQMMKDLGKAPKELANHLDQLWERDDRLKEAQTAIKTGQSMRSMRGPNYFFNPRKILDIPTGIAEGFKPKYPTLPEMAIAGRAAREHFIAAQKRINDLETNGYQKVVKNLDNIPEGWRQMPGGYGEVWARVERRAGQMIPEYADENVMPLGGGPGRAGYEEVPGFKGWTRVGYRIAPDYVVTQFENFLGKGLKGGDIYSIYQGTIDSIRTFQMALSWFHATFESLNTMATQAGRGMMDSIGGLFTGDFARMGSGLKALGTSPLAPVTDIRLGIKGTKLLMDPESARNDPQAQQTLAIARILVSGGQRISPETKLSKVMNTYFREAWAEGKSGHGIRAANRIMRSLTAPVMDFIVPFAKLGSSMRTYMAEVERWGREHPGETMSNEQALRLAYETRETSDNVFGQMAMDNVGMNATIKSLLSGVIQFPTWNIGTVKVGTRTVSGISDLLLKAKDLIQGKEIRKLDIKDRQALQYTAGLLFTVGMVGGLMHYAFTGKWPEELADFYFPRTGQMNPNGTPERVQLPSYLKDALGITRHPGQTVAAKMAAPIHIITDLWNNRDYWGTQVYDPDSWWGSKGLDILKYVGKSATPFVLQSYQHGAQETPSRAVASLLGVRPVPREIANTPAQNEIDKYNQLMRAATTTKESKEQKDLKFNLMKLAKDQDTAGFEQAAGQAVSEGRITGQQVKAIIKESQVPTGLTRFTRLPMEWKLRTWDKASDAEKEQWLPYFLKAIKDEKPENLIKLREPVVATLESMGLTDAAQKVNDLTMPEKGTRFDLTGLGIIRANPEVSGMDAVDAAISRSLDERLRKIGGEKEKKFSVRLPSLTRKKKNNPYSVLGI